MQRLGIFLLLGFIGFSFTRQENLPALNQHIIAFVNKNMGKKVGTGECWDLAAEALNSGGAKWDGLYGFGRVIDPFKEAVLPGDIMQFERVSVERKDPEGIMKEIYGHHTAIVYQVNGTADYVLAHQNTGYTGRKVGTSPLRLSDIKKGKYTVFRPIADE